MGNENDSSILVRLPRELKADLMRQAAINGRRITVEINLRLAASLQMPSPGMAAASTPTTTYPAHTSQGPLIADERTPGAAPLNDHDRALLTVFRQLSPEKQLSLLTLLKP